MSSSTYGGGGSKNEVNQDRRTLSGVNKRPISKKLINLNHTNIASHWRWSVKDKEWVNSGGESQVFKSFVW